MALAEQAGDAVVDLGTPLAVDEAGGESGVPIGGYSTLRARSHDALAKVSMANLTWRCLARLEVLI